DVGVRHERDDGLAERFPQLFVVHEEEQLVSFDRSAKGRAELVLAEGRLRSAIEEVAGVKRAVAEELVGGSVEAVGARLRRRVDDSAVAAKLRSVSIGEDRKLRDRFDSQRRAHHPRARAVIPEALYVRAVEQISLAFRPRARHAEIVLDTIEQVRAAVTDLRSRGYPGNERDEIREVAAVERQVVDLPLLDIRRHARRHRIDLRPRAFDGYGL